MVVWDRGCIGRRLEDVEGRWSGTGEPYHEDSQYSQRKGKEMLHTGSRRAGMKLVITTEDYTSNRQSPCSLENSYIPSITGHLSGEAAGIGGRSRRRERRLKGGDKYLTAEEKDEQGDKGMHSFWRWGTDFIFDVPITCVDGARNRGALTDKTL